MTRTFAQLTEAQREALTQPGLQVRDVVPGGIKIPQEPHFSLQSLPVDVSLRKGHNRPKKGTGSQRDEKI